MSALLQATSLPFIVASTAIGVELNVITAANAAALIAAGLLSVLLFPLLALTLLKRDPGMRATIEQSMAERRAEPLVEEQGAAHPAM